MRSMNTIDFQSISEATIRGTGIGNEETVRCDYIVLYVHSIDALNYYNTFTTLKHRISEIY